MYTSGYSPYSCIPAKLRETHESRWPLGILGWPAGKNLKSAVMLEEADVMFSKNLPKKHIVDGKNPTQPGMQQKHM